jgi:PPM family protein phosphatase
VIRWQAAGATDIGLTRRRNEDAFRLDPEAGLFLVADGMGGHAAGEEASRLAVDHCASHLLRETGRGTDMAAALSAAFPGAREALLRRIDEDPRTVGMGTTLVVALVSREGEAVVANLGDSRAYLHRDGRLERITHDHSWVQREIDAGRLDAAVAESHPMAHVLTRVLSADSPPEPDLFPLRLRAGDRLLLASDGLTRMVPEPQIGEVMAGGGPPAEIATELVRLGNEHGGIDNITAVVVTIEEGGDPA